MNLVNKLMVAVVGLIACCLLMPCFLTAQNRPRDRDRQQQGCAVPLNVGFKIVSIPGGPMMAVWYPTDEREQPHNYSPDIQGSIALNSPISLCQRFPLVVFSHGFSGCGTQSIFITEELARRGYVVAAPDHRDSTCKVDGTGAFSLRASERSFFKPETWTDSTYLDRKRDIESVIDWVVRSPEFSRGVDPARIGLAGHSTGGYVALGMAGAWKSWTDRRIKAVLLFSPYALPFLKRNLLQGVDVPVMYQGAQLDLMITPSLQGKTGAYASTRSPKFFVELKGGTHLEWTNLLCLGTKTIANCVSSRPNAALILSYSTMFLDRFLKDSRSAPEGLRGSGLAAFQSN